MKKRYVPDLELMHSVCEVNYLKLQRLLGDFEDDVYQLKESDAVIRLNVTERFKFTSTLVISTEQHHLPCQMGQLVIAVRLYHDARLAEVVNTDNFSQLAGAYVYPNSKMNMPDEKKQANLFLGEWLNHLLYYGFATLSLNE